ncbi:hypothetical protein G9A89_008543 [Geosiphon pyriformis]|nr:hypothetical protein G9A89_008543 [Geosiphon pyriformis]
MSQKRMLEEEIPALDQVVNNIDSTNNSENLTKEYPGSSFSNNSEARQLRKIGRKRPQWEVEPEIEPIQETGDTESVYKGHTAKRTRLDPVLREKREVEVASSTKRHHQKGQKSTQGKNKVEEPHLVKYINEIVLGDFVVKTQYPSPYPEEYAKAQKLYVCERCLKYMKSGGVYGRHITTCRKSPPGPRIYKGLGKSKETIYIYAVDGAAGSEEKLYAQLLSLLGRNWIDSKLICYDVERFCFFVITFIDPQSGVEHTAGYFSKEKISYGNFNLACICVFPQYQKRGYGSVLIELSYELSIREDKVGSPEEPVTSAALRAYHSYWKKALLRVFCEGSNDKTVSYSLDELAEKTGIRIKDILTAMKLMGLKKWCKRGSPNAIVITRGMIGEYLNGAKERWGSWTLEEKGLNWPKKD